MTEGGVEGCSRMSKRWALELGNKRERPHVNLQEIALYPLENLRLYATGCDTC